ncbi:glycosyltransferase family 2 protein [Aliiglaciecola sp. 3_MG-2023]|uniref:glycosyltransferase family 2 protein n=1 Tax=Aliiglaciecola sp. 3_MG-2023 TaxID=3062644 RepID=UPI0026E28E3C|nr:glycosyltransferase family 2 protein [Aliiglaciecola sp. 3_MG-2023]MDO6691859.1 glycosyltransferase family 2 protein [Aliiglaciecola sp. 3_MG-2023]
MNNSVSVIIPFYQRTSGLLTNALKGIQAQTALSRIANIIVIDDGSPTPAKPEIDAFNSDSEFYRKITLIKQNNSGVSRARNVGLEAVTDETEYVAFLDPDDFWQPEHVELSLKGLDLGSDFHFSNFTHMGVTIGAFERAGYIDPSKHPIIADEKIHEYVGDMVLQTTTANIIGTSTVFYRITKTPQLRFDENFKFAGEDYLMWLSILKYAQKITFTNSITVRYGEGINLFSGAKWGSKHMCKRLFDEINYRYFLLHNITMTEANRKKVKEMLYDNRQAYIGNLQSMLKRLKLSALGLFYKHYTQNKPFRDTLLKRID